MLSMLQEQHEPWFQFPYVAMPVTLPAVCKPLATHPEATHREATTTDFELPAPNIFLPKSFDLVLPATRQRPRRPAELLLDSPACRLWHLTSGYMAPAVEVRRQHDWVWVALLRPTTARTPVVGAQKRKHSVAQ
jgi:secreted Zn-dependent insulinase-like peptidase